MKVAADCRTFASFVIAPRNLRARRAFTLVEMLVVVAIVAALSAMVMPGTLRYLSERRLVGGADAVREMIAQARLAAIETGEPAEFRYEPGGSRYVMVTTPPVSAVATAANQQVLAATASSTMSSNTAGSETAAPFANSSSAPLYRVRTSASGKLPKGVTFVSAKTVLNPNAPTEQLSATLLNGLPNAGELTQVSWSPAIRFYPRGFTSDMEIPIHDTEGRLVRLIVRGLTGMVRVSPITSESNASRGATP